MFNLAFGVLKISSMQNECKYTQTECYVTYLFQQK